MLRIGSAAARARLRRQLHPSLVVAGEFESDSEARASGLPFDALLVAPAAEPLRAGAPLAAADEAIEDPLTPRELQVLELLAAGLSNKGIGARLGISDQTVKFHVASICGKLGAANRTDAVRRALRRGLIAL